MGNNVVKSILVAVLLVVLSFTVGVSAADDAKGAATIIMAICGAFVFLWMGKNLWLLLFYVPILVTAGFALPVFVYHLTTYVIAICVFFALLLQRIRGEVRFVWRSLPALDIPFFVLMALVAYALYRFPVLPKSITSVIGIDMELSGGREYLWALIASLGYLVYSAIPVDIAKLEKHVKYIIILGFILASLYTVRGMIAFSGKSVGSMGADATLTNSRVTVFSGISMMIWNYIFGTQKIGQICTSVRSVILVAMAGVGILLTGTRGVFAMSVMSVALLLVIKRQFLSLIIIAVVGYGSCLMLFYSGTVYMLPYGVQRVMSEVPGVELSGAAAESAKGSSRGRDLLEQAGFDPNSGYIKDYVWGDGFGFDHAQVMRLQYGTNRLGKHDEAMQLQYMNRTWHYGLLYIINALGYVGLAVIIWLSTVTFWFIVITLRKYDNHKLSPLLVLILANIPHWLINLYFRAGSGDFISTCAAYLMMTIFAKFFYCEGVKMGLIEPLLKRKSYVPMTVRDRQHEDAETPEYPLPKKLKKLLNK